MWVQQSLKGFQYRRNWDIENCTCYNSLTRYLLYNYWIWHYGHVTWKNKYWDIEFLLIILPWFLSMCLYLCRWYFHNLFYNLFVLVNHLILFTLFHSCKYYLFIHDYFFIYMIICYYYNYLFVYLFNLLAYLIKRESIESIVGQAKKGLPYINYPAWIVCKCYYHLPLLHPSFPYPYLPFTILEKLR